MVDNLNLPSVAANQNQKEVTINDAVDQLSSALTDDLAIATGNANYTLSLANFQDYLCFFVSGNTAAHNFTLPQQKRTLFAIQNGDANPLPVILGSTTLYVPAGSVAFFRQDGTANGLTKFSPSLEQDIGVCVSGAPSNNQEIVLPFNQSVQFPIGLVGSNFFVDTNPTATTTLTIYKNGSSIGTIAFNTSGVPTVTFTAAVTFAIGDKFKVGFPAVADATAANFGLNFKATIQ